MLHVPVIRLDPDLDLPSYARAGDAGADLVAREDALLAPGGGRALVPTGVAIAAPPGTDVQIRPRSGLSSRGVMSTFGTIDADYRGELFVTMYCLPSVGSYVIEDGERIAQLVVSRLAEVSWIVVQALDETSRGASGHGSTGRG